MSEPITNDVLKYFDGRMRDTDKQMRLNQCEQNDIKKLLERLHQLETDLVEGRLVQVVRCKDCGIEFKDFPDWLKNILKYNIHNEKLVLCPTKGTIKDIKKKDHPCCICNEYMMFKDEYCSDGSLKVLEVIKNE